MRDYQKGQTYFWETELFSDVKGVPEKLAFAGWSIEEMDGVLFGEVLLMHLEPFTDEELEDLVEKIEQINSTDFAIRMKHWSVLTDAGLLHLKDRCRSISVVKLTGADPNGRYGVLTAGTVPAVSIQNGV